MKTKKIKIKTAKAIQVKRIYLHFGYELVSEINMGDKTELIFQQLPVPNQSKIDKLEKQYCRLFKKFPIAATIFIGIGIILLFVGVFTKMPGYEAVNITLISIGSFSIAISIFLYFGFLLTIIYREKIIKAIIKQAQIIYPVDDSKYADTALSAIK